MRGYYEQDKGSLLETKMSELGLKEITSLTPKEREGLFESVGPTIKFRRNECNRKDWYLIEDIMQFWEGRNRNDSFYEKARFFTLGSTFSYASGEFLILQFYKENSPGLVKRLLG